MVKVSFLGRVLPIVALAANSFGGEDAVKTVALMSEFGFSRDAILTNETALSSSSVPATVSTNGFELTLYNYSAMHGLVRPEQPDQIRIVCQLDNNRSHLLGTGFVYRGPTNSLVEMAAPLVANSMPLALLKEYWSPVPEVTGVCLRGTPTNEPPTRVFLARRGAVCILKSTAVTNLVEIAEIVCDTLSPPAEASP